jgi:predicted O-methyltransferase YrrM
MNSPTLVHRIARPIKKILPETVWSPARAYATGILTPFRFSTVTGHWRSSLRRAACDRTGKAIPWYTYPAIDFLQQRDFRDKAVLEFGGGHSTIWWAARANHVLTIEEDEAWFKRIASAAPTNASVHHLAVDRGTRSIVDIRQLVGKLHPEPFDVVVIDGHLRRELVCFALEKLSPSGAVIFDNAEAECFGFYNETKWRSVQRIDFYGFAPGVSLRHCTSILFDRDCFLLAPQIPIIDLERPAISD